MKTTDSAIKHFVGKKVIHVVKPVFVGKNIYREGERREVVLMAIVDSYAMVRRPRCAPYVCSVNELEPA